MRRPAHTTDVIHAATLAAFVALAAMLATSLHRTGHTIGDDFALYLRQARSVFDGDIGAVIADNRFTVLHSDPLMGPNAYPWVWPLVLSPFVHLWGLDYDRLKLVEVGVYCAWLVLLHGIVRRRIGRLAALAMVAVFATAPAYLQHTDQLLTELPHLTAVGVFVWWYDRMRSRGTLLTARTSDLVWLGVLTTVAFNVRRESVALLGVIAVMQVYDLVAARVRPIDDWRVHWRTLGVPYLTFAVSVALFHFLLPTALLPNNANEWTNIDDRMGEFPRLLGAQAWITPNPWVGGVILLLAAAGAVIGVRRRPGLDGALLALAVLSALTISTHPRTVERYWLQVTPWVVYFATVAAITVIGAVAGRTRLPRRAVAVIAVTPLFALVLAHAAILPGKVQAVSDYHAAGRVQSGPTNPAVAPIFVAVREHTPSDATIAYVRARTMTLLTERRAFQTKHLDRILLHADYFAQRRYSTYWQPALTTAEARALGLEQVWSDVNWILWRIPDDLALP